MVGNILDKEISSTVGSQLLWVMATVLITLLLDRALNHSIDKLTQKLQALKTKYYEKPKVVEKQMYKKIKKKIKQNRDEMPQRFPPGLSLRYYRDMREENFKFSYKPLEKIVEEYYETYDVRLRKYFIDHPEEREKHDAQMRELAISMERMKNGINILTNPDYFNFPR